MGGFTANIYRACSDLFSPNMLQVHQLFYQTGTPLETWTTLLNTIPKVATIVSYQELRPLFLQNMCNKWIVPSIALQLQDLILIMCSGTHIAVRNALQ